MNMQNLLEFMGLYDHLFQISDNEKDMTFLLWSICRILLIGRELAEQEFVFSDIRLIDYYKIKLTQLFINENEDDSKLTQNVNYLKMHNILNYGRIYMNHQSDRKDIVLEILNNKYIMRYDKLINNNQRIPYTSISEVVFGLDENNDIHNMISEYYLTKFKFPLAVEIFDKLCLVPLNIKDMIYNDEQIDYSLTVNINYWLYTAYMVNQLINLPMMDYDYENHRSAFISAASGGYERKIRLSPTTRYIMARYREFYLNATLMWRRLGLSKEYIIHYSTDELFWQSPLTFMEIYHRLKSSELSN